MASAVAQKLAKLYMQKRAFGEETDTVADEVDGSFSVSDMLNRGISRAKELATFTPGNSALAGAVLGGGAGLLGGMRRPAAERTSLRDSAVGALAGGAIGYSLPHLQKLISSFGQTGDTTSPDVIRQQVEEEARKAAPEGLLGYVPGGDAMRLVGSGVGNAAYNAGSAAYARPLSTAIGAGMAGTAGYGIAKGLRNSKPDDWLGRVSQKEFGENLANYKLIDKIFGLDVDNDANKNMKMLLQRLGSNIAASPHSPEAYNLIARLQHTADTGNGTDLARDILTRGFHSEVSDDFIRTLRKSPNAISEVARGGRSRLAPTFTNSIDNSPLANVMRDPLRHFRGGLSRGGMLGLGALGAAGVAGAAMEPWAWQALRGNKQVDPNMIAEIAKRVSGGQ